MTYLADLARIITYAGGAIPAVRVSSAKARGAAKQYPYWGAARYIITLDRDGLPTCRATECASSDRRVRQMADLDAAEMAKNEGRVRTQAIGRLSDAEAADVLAQIEAAL